MKFSRFTHPRFWEQLGRPVLTRFFGRFEEDLIQSQISLPDPGLEDRGYFAELARLSMNPDRLPEPLIEALFAIEEMANAHGQQQLERAMTEAGISEIFTEGSTHADIAMQAWLAAPDLLAQLHNELRLSRLTAFEYFGSVRPHPHRAVQALPAGEAITALTADLDAWFAAHHRGHRTTQIEVHPLGEEIWFMIRHGDTFARKAKVENEATAVLHFRPAVDDVVVYNPDRDEIRINAKTAGERELYRVAFGFRLFESGDHFSVRKAYTLTPLHQLGVDALETEDLEGIERVILREIEVAWPTRFNEVSVFKATDVFAASQTGFFKRDVVPHNGEVTRAVFEVFFTGEGKPRRVQVKPPNLLKLGRHCDGRAVHEWLSKRGFRQHAGEINHVGIVEAA